MPYFNYLYVKLFTYNNYEANTNSMWLDDLNKISLDYNFS